MAMRRKAHSATGQERRAPGKPAQDCTHVCMRVRTYAPVRVTGDFRGLRLLRGAFRYILPALATMAPKLDKKSGSKASSATSSQSSSPKNTSRVDLRKLTASKKALGSPGRKNSKPASAPINLYVWQYSSDCHAWLTAPCANSKLYAVMLEHEAFPSVADSIVAGFNAFLQHSLDSAEANERDNCFATLNDMKAELGIALNLTKIKDNVGQELPNPCACPWEPWNVCFWVPAASDELVGFLSMLHDYFEHRSMHPLPGTDRSPWPSLAELEVRIHPYVNVVSAGFVEAFPRVRACVATPSRALAKSIWIAKPPSGNTVVVCDVQVESGESAILAWHGRTWEFRSEFNDVGIPLCEEAKRFRLLPEANRLLSLPENVDFVNGIFGAHVLKDAFVNLRISDEKDAAAGSAVASFLGVLKSRPNIFVDAW